MQTSLAKKLFAAGMALSTAAMALAPFAAHAAAHAVGTNVKTSDGTVWMIMPDGTRRAYTSAGAFLSYGFNSFATLVDANSDDTALPQGAFIPPQDGTIFCATETKASDVKGECSLITGGMKAAFTSESNFTGRGFSFSNAQYGDSSFLTKTTNIDNTTDANRPGVLVNDNGTVKLVGNNGVLGIPDLATFNSWGYSWAKVVPANAADKALPQTGVMAARQAGQLSPTALTGGNTGGNNPPVVSGSVSASLAYDTPAASSVVAGQAIADLAHFTFSGTGTVTQVVLKRIGVSADATLSNVFLYNGNNKLTDAGSVSNSTVTFSNSNGLFTVNGSMTISVKSDIESGISGQTVGAQLASFTVANGTPVSTSISGNLMTVASVSDLATVTLNSVTNTPGASVTAGSSNQTLWSGNFTVTQRKVNLKYVAFKNVGSVQPDAIQNLKLYVAGAAVGNTTNVDNNNNVVFDLTGSPVSVNTGSLVIELRGDVVKGSSFTFNFRVQTVSDIVLVDSNYNVNISMAGTFPAYPATTTTVSSGSVSIQADPNFTTTQVVKNSANVNLGQWTMKAYGENVKVQSLKVVLSYFDSVGNATTTATSTEGAAEGFTNLALQVDGGGVGSNQNNTANNVDHATSTFGTTNLFTINAGQTVTLTVKGDMSLNTTTRIASVRADVYVVANTMQGLTSYNTSPSSSANYQGSSLTVSSSSVTTAKNASYSDQVISSNLTHQKIGSFVIQASNADGVRVTSLTVLLNLTTLATTDLANLYITTPSGNATPVNPQSTNNFSVDFTVAANQTANVDVYADITNNTGSIVTRLYGSGTGVDSQQAVYLTSDGLVYGGSNYVAGQTITVGSGVMYNPTKNTGASPVAQFVVGGTTNQPSATYNFVSTTSSVTITELHFAVTGTSVTGGDTPITSVHVGGKDGTVVSNAVTITGLNIVVPSGYSGLDVPVTVDYAPVGLGGATSSTTVISTLNYVKYLAGSTTKTLTPSVAASTMTLVGSKPAVTLAAPSGSLTTGTVKIASVTVAADAGGNIKLENLPITVATSGTVSLASGSHALVYINGSQYTSISDSAFTGAGADVITFTGGYTIPAGQSVTFDVYATIGGSLGSAGSSSVSTQITSSTLFTWTDVKGNVSSITGEGIANFPSGAVSLHN